MGSILSYFWSGGTGRNDDADPVTGLTSRDRYILTTTWSKLSTGDANLKTGMAIFLNLFAKYPEYQQLFPFKNVPRELLSGENRFRAHCISLMYAVSSIIDNIDNPPVLEQLLIKQGVAHVPRKVPKKAYWELKEVLMEVFAKSITQEELQIWDKFLDLGLSIVIKGADSVDQK